MILTWFKFWLGYDTYSSWSHRRHLVRYDKQVWWHALGWGRERKFIKSCLLHGQRVGNVTPPRDEELGLG
jgi:hypothetical protein